MGRANARCELELENFWQFDPETGVSQDFANDYAAILLFLHRLEAVQVASHNALPSLLQVLKSTVHGVPTYYDFVRRKAQQRNKQLGAKAGSQAARDAQKALRRAGDGAVKRLNELALRIRRTLEEGENGIGLRLDELVECLREGRRLVYGRKEKERQGKVPFDTAKMEALVRRIGVTMV